MRWTKRKENGRWPDGVPKPCIPTRSDTVPSGAAWLHEIKHDGYRLMVHRDGASVRVITLGGYDWLARYPAIVSAARRLPSKRFLIDGEGVVEGCDGVADFSLLHSRQHDAWCYLIGLDLLELGKRDLRPLPLEMRKSLLSELLDDSTAGIVYADHIDGDGAEVFAAASRLGLEGIVSKRRDRSYTSGLSKTGSRSRIRTLGHAAV
jgi:bifunctional non-homologous end joining protein LigD